MNRRRSHQRTEADAAREDAAMLPGMVSSIQAQQRRADRVNVFVDGAFAFAARAEIVAQHGIHPGTELTVAVRDAALREDAYATAYATAIDLLARRARSEREIRDRLRAKGHDAETIDRVLIRLRELRYIDDESFSRSWIENRATHRPRGAAALRQELRAKGVDRQTIDQAIEEASLDDVAMAVDAASRKHRSLESLDPQLRRRRLIGYLQRRGFTWDAIREALRQVEPDAVDADDEGGQV
jgi:regulatory protein